MCDGTRRIMASIKATSVGERPSNGWRFVPLDDEVATLEMMDAELGVALRLSEGSIVATALR